MTADLRRACAAAALVAIGVLRIVLTYDDLSETVDEVAHVGAGMEWLALKRYAFEPQHPPVARIAAAAGPYVLGVRAQHQADLWREGRRVLYADGAYLRNLTAARLGVLPFFVVAAFFVWRTALTLFGSSVALGAVASFTLLPPVLAHFGLATTDGPLTAMVAAVMFAVPMWLRGPTIGRGIALGLAGGLALVTKFSSVPYVGAFLLLTVAAYAWSLAMRRRAKLVPAPTPAVGPSAQPPAAGRGAVDTWSWARAAVSLAAAAATAFVVAWAVYRFSTGTIRGMTVPFPELFRGLREVADHNRSGHPTYFLGQFRSTGVWYYFPVVLALKTPLAGLVLAGVGLVTLVRDGWRTLDWKPLVPVAVAVAILAVAMVSRINIGVRHVLPIYLALAIAIGVAWDRVWHAARKWWERAVLVGATVALSVGTVTIHPDYLAYFNALGGREPSRLVAGSDHEWGQDMLRLARAVRERKIDSLTFAYIGTADLSPIIGARVRYWDGTGRATGWVAVAETMYRMGAVGRRGSEFVSREDAFFWLDSVATYTRIGKGIRLYHVPPATGAAGAGR